MVGIMIQAMPPGFCVVIPIIPRISAPYQEPERFRKLKNAWKEPYLPPTQVDTNECGKTDHRS